MGAGRCKNIVQPAKNNNNNNNNNNNRQIFEKKIFIRFYENPSTGSRYVPCIRTERQR